MTIKLIIYHTYIPRWNVNGFSASTLEAAKWIDSIQASIDPKMERK